MGRTVQQTLPGVEVKKVERAKSTGLNKVERLEFETLHMAKAGFGAAVEHAIGDNPLKAFGDKGWMSNVTAGPGVPDYLARIWADRKARRRLGLALLKDDPGVRVRLTIECELDDE